MGRNIHLCIFLSAAVPAVFLGNVLAAAASGRLRGSSATVIDPLSSQRGLTRWKQKVRGDDEKGMGTAAAMDACSSGPCQNGGECALDGNGGYTCNCPCGYEGANCETDINYCASNPCENGATCQDMVNGYKCFCAVGFMGPGCKINRGTCDDEKCQNGAQCVDFAYENIEKGPQKAYNCTCLPGFMGTRCEFESVLSGAATSTETTKKAVPAATTNPPKREAPEDACSSRPCRNGGTCKSNGSRYVCVCPAGFMGVSCETKKGSCSPNTCKNGGECMNQGNSYICTCLDGYTGDTCEDGDEEANFAENGEGGESLPGTESQEDGCVSSPCQNGGTCVNNPDGSNGYTCTCLDGFMGASCEASKDSCSSSPCQNGGTCMSQGNSSFKCTCPAGFMGATCNTEKVTCSPNPCKNGGECTSKGDNYVICSCPDGYTGITCKDSEEEANFAGNGEGDGSLPGTESQEDGCSSSPCQNGGTCTSGVEGRYICDCSSGYRGQNCEIELPDGEDEIGSLGDEHPLGDHTGLIGTCNDILPNDCSNPCFKGVAGFDAFQPYCEGIEGQYDSKRYIQCDNHGGCFVKECCEPYKTFWDDGKKACVVDPKIKPPGDGSCDVLDELGCPNPCTEGAGGRDLLYPFCPELAAFNASKFVQCDNHGGCWLQECCVQGTIFDDKVGTCDWENGNTGGVPPMQCNFPSMWDWQLNTCV